MTTTILECFIGVLALIVLVALAGYAAGVHVDALLAHVVSQAGLPSTN